MPCSASLFAVCSCRCRLHPALAKAGVRTLTAEVRYSSTDVVKPLQRFYHHFVVRCQHVVCQLPVMMHNDVSCRSHRKNNANEPTTYTEVYANVIWRLCFPYFFRCNGPECENEKQAAISLYPRWQVQCVIEVS